MKSWKWEHINELVQSLSVNEKRYFSLMQKMNSKEKNYLRLFEAINQQLSQKQITEKFAETKINISYEKSYLTKMLLKSLRNFHESSSIDTIIYQALFDIEILLDKKLYVFCLAYTEYYLELCKECELYEFQLLLLKGKRRCILRMGNADAYAANNSIEAAIEKDCLQKLENINTFKALHQQTHQILNRKEGLMNAEDKAMLTKIVENKILNDINNAHSFLAKMMFYDIKIWYYSNAVKNHTTAYEYSVKKIELLETNTFVLKSSPLTYMSVYANHYIRTYALGKIDELPNVIAKIDLIANSKSPFISQDIKNEAFSHSSEKILDYCVATLDFTNGVRYFMLNKKRMKQQNFKLNAFFYMTQHYFVAYFYFHLKEYKNAIKHIKITLDDFKPETRLLTYMCAKMLNILIQFELNNFELIPYLLKSTERLLKLNQIEYQSFFLTDALLKKITPTTSKKEKKDLFANYISQLNNLTDTSDIAFANDIGLFFWAQGKLK
ncbi:MAG TPA: hypothetical protein PLS10_00450 [Chitinophagales bacterium]|nr:hypothetical protein [Chitinophagales bacterium]